MSQDFAVQQLERRINRMQGERSNEEKIQLEAKIKDLTEELDQKNNTYTLLTLQLKRLQVKPNQNLCVVPVSQPYLGFCPDI